MSNSPSFTASSSMEPSSTMDGDSPSMIPVSPIVSDSSNMVITPPSSTMSAAPNTPSEIETLVLPEQLETKISDLLSGKPTHIWLRHETKPGEERTALLPQHVKTLMDAGYRITVERSPTRCVPDAEYEKLGCEMADTTSWPKAPRDAIILGLKELPEGDEPLVHRHVFFAHCYKYQNGWERILRRFAQGGGLLYDMEFLVDDEGKRVAAFGRSAGMAGMGVAIKIWVDQQVRGFEAAPYTQRLTSWKSVQDMIMELRTDVSRVIETKGLSAPPSVLVIGANGRCGGGSVWVAEQCGLSVTKWGRSETARGGPFIEFLQHDIVSNCIYLLGTVPPFLTHSFIAQHAHTRKLSVITDVSCDPNSENNPLPIYNTHTYLTRPVLRVCGAHAHNQSNSHSEQQQQPQQQQQQQEMKYAVDALVCGVEGKEAKQRFVNPDDMKETRMAMSLFLAQDDAGTLESRDHINTENKTPPPTAVALTPTTTTTTTTTTIPEGNAAENEQGTSGATIIPAVNDANPLVQVNTTISDNTATNTNTNMCSHANNTRPLDIIAIDHLPSLIPLDSSADFVGYLLPFLLQLKNVDTHPVWARAAALFQKKCEELKVMSLQQAY